jgi:hypothetical protein
MHAAVKAAPFKKPLRDKGMPSDAVLLVLCVI